MHDQEAIYTKQKLTVVIATLYKLYNNSYKFNFNNKILHADKNEFYEMIQSNISRESYIYIYRSVLLNF